MKLESQLQVSTSSGVAPFTVNQATLVSNLNAQYLNGQLGGYYAAASSLASYLPLAGGTLTGAITVNGVSDAVVVQTNGNAAQWYGRISVRNSTSDKSSFLGTYQGVAGVFAHNNALNAWADLYVNTVDGSGGGTVRMPSSVLISGNQVVHAATTSAPNLSIGGSSTSCTGSSAQLNGQAGSYYQDAGNLNAGTLLAARMPAHTGDVTSTAGTVGLTLASVGTAGTYRSVTTDAKGRVTAGTNPTTLAGYGITDAMSVYGQSHDSVSADSLGTSISTGGIYTIASASAGSFTGSNDALFHMPYASTAWAHQIALAWNTPRMGFRTKNSGTWTSWSEVLHSDNYTSYPPARWATGRTISLTGDVTGTSVAFDGTAALSFAATLANSGATAGTYTKVTVNAKGLITAGTSLTSADLPTYTGTITSGQVTTGLGFTPYNASNPSNYITASASITGYSGGVSSSDTRSVVTTPQTIDRGVVFDFKTNTTDGLSDGGSYFGEMTFRPYGSGTDWSGTISHQLGFTDAGNIWQRSGSSTTWAAWKKMLDSSNYSSYALPLAGGTLTGGLSGTTGYFSSDVTWSGYNSGNPRSARLGYSGGNYGSVSYGINYTATTASHTYAFNDAVTRIDLADGIQVYSAAAAVAGTAVSWTTLLEATRGNGNLRWKGNTVLDSNNYNSFALPLGGGTMTGSITLPAAGYVGLSGGSTFGIGVLATNRNSGVFDTLESTGSDPLELNYYQGGPVKIGSGTYGSKSLYAVGIYDNGNAVLTSTSTSAPSLSIGGSSASCTGNAATATRASTIAYSVSIDKSSTDLNNETSTGFFRGVTMTNAPDTGWWWVMGQSHDNTGSAAAGWNHQLAIAYGAGNTYGVGTMMYRSRTGGTSYSSWGTVLTSANYSSYALPLAGGTLTGGITATNFTGPGTGLTGTATSLTAGAVPWSGITSKPTTFGGFGITDLVYGSTGSRNVWTITDWNQGAYPNAHFLSSESSTANAPSSDYTYGLQTSFHRSGAAYRTQMVTELYSSSSIWVRNSRDSDVWTAWSKLLHSNNYSSYALPLSGGTLTGDLTISGASRVFVGSYMNIASSVGIPGMIGLNRNVTNGAIFNASYGAYQIHNNAGLLEIQTYTSVGGYVGAHTFNNSGNVAFITGTVTAGGNQVLHAGNVATYALPIGGGTLTGTLNGTAGTFSGPLIVNNDNGVRASYDNGGSYAWLYGYGIEFGRATSYIRPNTNRVANLWVGNASINSLDWANIDFYSSGRFNVNNNAILHAGNYNSYALPLAGGAITGAVSIIGQTVNGQSHYQWDGGTYRNPGDWTATLIARRDNSTVGINGSIPALVLYNNNGGDQTTVGLSFASAEGATGQGNAVALAGIVARKEGAGTVGGWSSGSLNFYVKNVGARVDALNISSTGTANFPIGLQQGGNQVLHAGNFSSYALPLAGGTMTGGLTITNLFGNANSASLYANNSSNGYGSWKVGGTKSGWYGIEFESGSNLMMNSNQVGFHRNGYGWQLWWSAGTAYCHKGDPGAGTQATILDSSNVATYALPIGGGTLTGALNGTSAGFSSTVAATGQISANGGLSISGSLYQGVYTRRQIVLNGPGIAAFGNWKQFIRLWAVTGSGGNMFTLKVSVRGTWNYTPVFGTVEACYALYLPADGTIAGTRDFRIVHVSGPATDNIRLGDAVIENGYASIPIWCANTNGLEATVEQWNGSQILGTVTTAVSEALPAFIAPNFRGGLTSDGNTVLHAGNYNSYALPLSGGTLASTNDQILTLNKSSGTGWGYIGFSQAGTRRFYFGLNASFEPELGVDNGGTFRVNGGMTVGGNAVLTSASTSASSLSIGGNAATATRTSSQSGYAHAGTGMVAFYNWGGTNQGTNAPDAGSYTTGISVGSHPGDQAYGFQIANNMWNSGLWTRNYNSGFGSWVRLLDSSNYNSYALPLTGGALTGTVSISTTSSGAANRTVVIKNSGQSIYDFGSYAGAWRSALQIQSNSSDRLLFFVPPETGYEYGIIRAANGGLNIDVGGTLATTGTTGIRIEASGAVSMPGTLNVVGAVTQNGNQVLHAGNYGGYSTFSGIVSSASGGFQTATYAAGRNRIWTFGNADGYGINYYQGAGGISGNDVIGLNFGNATAALAQFQFLASGSLNATGTITATNFSGPGTGLTGTASGLNIGGNANNITQYTVNQSVGTGNSPSFTGLSVINTITGAVSGNAGTVTNATFYSQFTVRGNRTDGNDYSLAGRPTGLYAITAQGTNGTGAYYSSLIHVANGDDVAFQIAGGYNSDAMYFRGTTALQSGTGYSAWRAVIHSGNIASQTVATAGSCTGNAASASSLAADTSTRFKILTFTGVGGDSGNGSVPDSYAIYQQGGSWTHPYPDLCIGYHTGIKIGAYYGYGGTRFYNNSDWSTEIFSVGNGDNNVRVVNTIYAAAFSGPLTGNVTGNLTGNVNGYGTSTGTGANTIVVRDANGYIFGYYFNSSTSESENPSVNSFFTSTGDGYLRKATVAHVKYTLSLSGTNTGDQTNISGSSGSCTGSSAQLNGQAASYYENRDTTAVGISAGTLTLTRAAGNLTTTIGGRIVAWCEFNGNFASTQSPNAGFNVSSITKNATGDYTVNFTSALANANYVVAGSAQLDAASPGQSTYNVMVAVPRRSGAKATGSCRIVTEYPLGVTLYDSVSVGVAFIAA